MSSVSQTLLLQQQQPIFVLLLSPYKVGSCFISKVLADNNIPHARLHSYDAIEQQNYPPSTVSHFITVRRKNQLDLYISAYYADIHQKPHYPYAYAASYDEVLAASTESLVDHFFSQPWRSYRWLNFGYYQAWVNWFQRRSVPTLVLETENLSETIAPAFRQIFGSAVEQQWNFDVRPSHVTGDNPNGLRYAELKKSIKDRASKKLYLS